MAAVLPHVLSREELTGLFDRTYFLKHRALLLTTYAAGLRASEVVAFRVRDLDSDRGVIRVEQGKGARGRTTLLSPRLLEVLRQYWQQEQPGQWLLPPRDRGGRLCAGAAKHAYAKAKQRAQIHKPWAGRSASRPSFPEKYRVFSRDGWHCTVPGCTAYRNLQDHHIAFRSAGGSEAARLSASGTTCGRFTPAWSAARAGRRAGCALHRVFARAARRWWPTRRGISPCRGGSAMAV